MNQLCKVCGEPAAGFHFGAFTCEGCKSFFGRTYNNVSGVSECKNGGRCEINKKNRTSCKSCRLRKCLQVGMSKSGSRYGRRSNWFKIHCLLSSQGQNGGMNSLSETNNNNSTVTNNNNANSNSSGVNHHQHTSKHHVPSTVTSHGHGAGGGHGTSESDPDRDRGHHHHRQRSSSSGTTNSLHHLPNQMPPTFHLPNVSAMSPDTKEQFLSSLNRKMMTPDLLEYFRSANLSLPPGVGLPKPFFPEERLENMSRTSRSPGSLESPNSEASGDDTKPSPNHLPLFGLPPGSPLDVKPNDILSFDLLTRDLMKLGYDPVRFWPAMLSAPPTSLHQFNPYRFMFPNFPGGGASGGPIPPGFPPSPMLGNGFLGGPLLPNGNPLIPNSNKLLIGPSSTESSAPPPHPNRRFPLIVPPASSLTLTPPISHHGSDEPNNLSTSKKIRNKLVSQDQPIDLSAKTLITNNNNDIESFMKVKGEIPSEGSESDISDFDDDDEEDVVGGTRVHGSCSDSGGSSSGRSNKDFVRTSSLCVKKSFHNSSSSLRDSGQDEDHCDGDDESESFSRHQNHRKERKRLDRRPSSTGSSTSAGPPHKKHKVSTPLDLTRPTSSNPPPTKVVAT